MFQTTDLAVAFGFLLFAWTCLSRRADGRWKSGRQAVLPAVLLIAAGGCLVLWLGDRSGLLKTVSLLPDATLAEDLASGDGRTADAAATELHARWERSALQQPLLEQVAKVLRARLASPEASWTVASSNLFLAARRDQLVSDAEFVQFIDRQLETQLITRPRVRAGRTWRVEVKCSTPQLDRSAPRFVPVMTSGPEALSPSASGRRAEKLGVTLHSLHDLRWRDEVLSGRTGGTTWMNLSEGSTFWATTSFAAPGVPGTGTLTGTIRVDVFDPWRDIADWDKRGRLLGSFERRLRAEAEVVDPAVAVLEPDTNASKAGLIRSSIAVQHPEIRLGRAEASSHPTFHAGCAVHYVGQALPDLAFQAFLRPQGAAAGTEWPIGTLVSVASRNNIYQGSLESSPIAGLGEIQPGQQFEIVLRPSPDLAESLSTRIHRPWSGGEIILDGIVPEVVKAPR